MPKLISSKNIGNPPVDGYVLSSSTVGVLEWTNEALEGSIDIDVGGERLVTNAKSVDLNKSNRWEVTEPNVGIASVVITTDALTISNL